MGAYTCPECILTNGWHFDEPDDPAVQPRSYRCPNRAATEQVDAARRLTADEHSKAAKAAQAIMRDLAQTRAEFSANDCRSLFDDAGVPPSLIGYAFRWAKTEGLIEETGRFVQSTQHTTRHRLGVWGSLVYRGRVAS